MSMKVEVDIGMVVNGFLEGFSSVQTTIFAVMLEKGEVIHEENLFIICRETEKMLKVFFDDRRKKSVRGDKRSG